VKRDICTALLMLFVAGVFADEPPKTKPWLTTLEDATDEARRLRQPIFVEFGAKWCGWCRKLEEELRKPEVQQELQRWTIVRLDVDRATSDARKLAVGGVPALRVLSPTGQVAASRDGYLPAAELVTWLQQQHELVLILPTEGLTGDEPPDAELLAKLLTALRHSDATLREAAIRRLLPHPGVAASAVLDAFAEGSLATRLAIIELLREWQAPATGLDPWQPETITPERLAELKAWAAALRDRAAPDSQPVGPFIVDTSAAQAEIDALLAADTQVAADAVRERLARFARDLLPDVYERLKAAATDRDRERLTALRYRLVATGELVLSWPGGLDRLAATDAAERHRAATELAERAKAADGPLLLELFSDSDPLVREIALRALRSAGGLEATDALVKLLRDPEPNVRAAVLKELAENPSSRLAPQLAAYVETEADPDLVVHAVRALRGGGREGAAALMKLLTHASWRVRAEAADALGELLSGRGDVDNEHRADVYVALIRLLDDEDGFVVSRAVKTLGSVDLVAAVEPLVRAAVRHPEIAAEAFKPLQRGKLRDKAVTPLRELCQHENAQLRAAAVAAVSTLGAAGLEDVVAGALSDTDRGVRLAGARAFLELLAKERPAEWAQMTDVDAEVSEDIVFGPATSRPAQSSTQPTTDEATQGDWLTQFRAGHKRPDWMTGAIDPLLAMLADESAEVRLAAALPLAALGRDDAALPVIEEVVRTQAALRTSAAPVLAWLPQEPRTRIFELLVSLGRDEAPLAAIAQALAGLPDATSAELLWTLVADERAADSTLTIVESALRQLYFGRRYYDPSRLSSATKKRLTAAAKPRATDGPELQRLVALLLLASADLDAAAEIAKTTTENDTLPKSLRRDAFQILLLTQSAADGRQTAVAALSRGAPETRVVALRYLAGGASDLRELRERGYWININNPAIHESYSTSGEKIVPNPPAGLHADVLRPLLSYADPDTTAYAGYLLSLLGERDGLPPLLKHWRDNQKNNDRWRRLVYRAIVAVGDDAQTPVLTEIYESYGKTAYEVREFYWTIRTLEGPQALKLRKRIRDEVGMNFLR